MTETKTQVTHDTYQPALDAFAQAARALIRLAEVIDLDSMRAVLGQFETLGPILDPTAYQRGGGLNLADQQVFLDATAAYVDKLKTIDRRSTGQPQEPTP